MTINAALLFAGAFYLSNSYEYFHKYIFNRFLIVFMTDCKALLWILLVGMVYDFNNNLEMAWKKEKVCFVRNAAN